MRSEELWALSAQEFNRWRSKNDIPLLLTYLAGVLPCFDEWLVEQNVSLAFLAEVFPTSVVFRGLDDSFPWAMAELVGPVDLYRATKDDESCIGLLKALANRPSRPVDPERPLVVEKTLYPYFHWFKAKFGRPPLIRYNKANKQTAETFVYTLWQSPDSPTYSQAHLFGSHRVLKLGGCVLQNRYGMGERNLDFVDLDHLTLKDFTSGSRYTRIAYSSLQHLRVENCEIPFFRVEACSYRDASFFNCRIQDHHYRNLNAGRIDFERCSVFRLTFEGASVLPMFRECDIKGVSFSPINDEAFYRSNAETFRLLRIAAQANGMRREASEFFYEERIQERKAAWAPYREDPTRINGYFGPLWKLVRDYRNGKTGQEHFKQQIRRHLRFRVSLLWPRNSAKFVWIKVRWFFSLVEWAVWGYGERPTRILASSLAAIGAYAVAYAQLSESILIQGPVRRHATWPDFIYLSLSSFTSLVFGDVTIKPGPGLIQFLCVSEALVGALAAGLVVAGFANRNRF